MSTIIPVVGIGADGLEGLSPRSRQILSTASAIYGSPRQIELVASLGVPVHTWPSPLLPALPELAERIAASHGAIIASGDPMFHGIGSTLVGLLGAERLRVYPAPSSVSLAAARMGWALTEIDLLSCVSSDPHIVLRTASPGARALVLSRDALTPVHIAQTLCTAGWAKAKLSILSDLGATTEAVFSAHATHIASISPTWSALCVTAIEYSTATSAAESDPVRHALASRAPGRADACYSSDGQLTKRIPRAIALSLLSPQPGELLWDIGGGAGSIGIEWMRCADRARAVCFERNTDRAATIADNARRLGVPGIKVVYGEAPEVLHDHHGEPDAIFIGGGLTAPGMLDICWEKLRDGGRLVAAAVTLESEMRLIEWHARHGGELTRAAIEHSTPLGRFTGWQPARSVVHLECYKPARTLGEDFTP